MITSTIKNNANDNTCKKNLRKNFFKSSPAVFSPIKIVLAFQCVVDWSCFNYLCLILINKFLNIMEVSLNFWKDSKTCKVSISIFGFFHRV